MACTPTGGCVQPFIINNDDDDDDEFISDYGWLNRDDGILLQKSIEMQKFILKIIS